MGKFDACGDVGIFLGYSTNNYTFRVFNNRISIVVESINVTIEDVEHHKIDPRKSIDTEDEYTSDTIVPHSDGHTTSDDSTIRCNIDEVDPKTVVQLKKLESRVLKNHPTYTIIGDITEGRKTKGSNNVDYLEMAGMMSIACYTSKIEPKNVQEANTDEY